MPSCASTASPLPPTPTDRARPPASQSPAGFTSHETNGFAITTSFHVGAMARGGRPRPRRAWPGRDRPGSRRRRTARPPEGRAPKGRARPRVTRAPQVDHHTCGGTRRRTERGAARLSDAADRSIAAGAHSPASGTSRRRTSARGRSRRGGAEVRGSRGKPRQSERRGHQERRRPHGDRERAACPIRRRRRPPIARRLGPTSSPRRPRSRATSRETMGAGPRTCERPCNATKMPRESADALRRIDRTSLRASARTPDGICRAAESTRSFRSGRESFEHGSPPCGPLGVFGRGRVLDGNRHELERRARHGGEHRHDPVAVRRDCARRADDVGVGRRDGDRAPRAASRRTS